MRRVAVTGATGYVGTVLLRRLGCSIRVLGRRPVAGHDFAYSELGLPFDPALLDGMDAVFHLATDTAGDSANDDGEIRYAAGLAAAAEGLGIPCVVVSSQVASRCAPSSYGRRKAAIEAAGLARGARIVRPGLVYGGPEKGLFGALVRLVRALPIVPDLRPGALVQPVHVDDLARSLVAVLRLPPAQVYRVAAEPMSFTMFLAAIAEVRLGRRFSSLPVPARMLRAILGAAALAGLKGFPPERLDSLLSIPRMDCANDLALLGTAPRPVWAGMSKSGGPARARIGEALALSTAMDLLPVSPMLLRRYARALEDMGVAPMTPRPRGRWAWLALDKGAPIRGSVPWRSGLVVHLAEAIPGLAGRFLPSRDSRWRALRDIAGCALIESVARLMRLLNRRYAG